MSQWTHINGSIRYDHISLGLSEIKHPIWNNKDNQYYSLDKILGNKFPSYAWNWDETLTEEKEVEYDELWDSCEVPIGSEGSIDYSIWQNPKSNIISQYTVNIWGDLRDFGLSNIDKVKSWFNKITDGFMIRSAILEIDIESHSTIILSYQDNQIKEIILEKSS